MYLRRKDRTEYTGPEQFVADKVNLSPTVEWPKIFLSILNPRIITLDKLIQHLLKNRRYLSTILHYFFLHSNLLSLDRAEGLQFRAHIESVVSGP